ncbi:LPD5 domain-containing protein [Paracoccus sp. ME4]|uniref:LPD5 domain-containing protein n=1 Tax=Paracoccus sp. ME4 TaxID=3138066 RepID=UPI00398BA5A8
MIQDFGEKIDGAAKDRWRLFRRRLDMVADGDVSRHTLAEIFPEPNYTAEISAGASSTVMSFIRTCRESIEKKPPAGSRNLLGWVSSVTKMRRMCRSILDSGVDAERIITHLEAQGRAGSAMLARVRAYDAIGHDSSLRDYSIGQSRFRSYDGITYNPPQVMWVCQSRKNRFEAVSQDFETVIDRLRDHLQEHAENRVAADAPRTRVISFSIYSYRSDPGTFWVGRKIGRTYMDLMSFPTSRQAQDYRRDHHDELVALHDARRRQAPERGGENADRVGPDWRGGRDISPGEFHATFQFRGVQFGNYVEGPKRQRDLNDAYDGLMDLSLALGVAPQALSLDGRLGLAFGARGTGGRNPAKAHYEPIETVINLTKNNGAGSLAHEWFHAHDNLIGRIGRGLSTYASRIQVGSSQNLTYDDRVRIDAHARLAEDLRAMPIAERSRNADRWRSSPYFGLSEEITARSFEAWVIDRLDRLDIRNDYLANILSLEVFAILDGDSQRYPYPTEAEMPRLRAAFEDMFRAEGPIVASLGGPHEHEVHERPGAAREARSVAPSPPDEDLRPPVACASGTPAIASDAPAGRAVERQLAEPVQMDLFEALNPEPGEEISFG